MTDNSERAAEALRAVMNDNATPQAVQSWILGILELLEYTGPDPRFVKGGPVPEGLGAMADEYSEVRNERLRIEKEAAGVKARESELYNIIMSVLDESTDTGASGQTYRVQRIEKERQNVKDWPAFWSYIQQHGAFELLQKRLNDKAVREMVEGGEALPGIEAEMVATLSFTKV
jgi:hypothetical protein